MKFVSFIIFLWIIVIINSVIGEELLSISIPESYSPLGEKHDKGKVDPKLDLENSDEESNSSNRTSSKYPKYDSSGKPTSPKIQGVRVTVDTGPNGKQDASGSKESVEILEPKKGKRVGIHTDITFEISEDSDTGNTTDSRNKDDSDVPIFKGRDSSTNRPRRPYDPKKDHHSWNNEPPQRHHSGGPSYSHGGRDNYYPSYPQTNDQEFYHGAVGGASVSGLSGGRGGYHGDSSSSSRRDGWTGYIPMTSVWTTERNYYSGGFKAYDAPRWKPCYCVSTDGRNRRDSRIGYLKVDDKLDLPFSRKTSK